jgi:CrcB protein
MIKVFTLVGVGGAIGSICRYLVAQYFQTRFAESGFPYGTMVVNITGCFVIGLIFAIGARTGFLSDWRLFLVTGICGGYTTFSSFSFEAMSLLHNKGIVHFFAYVGGSVILGLLATFIPIYIGDKL